MIRLVIVLALLTLPARAQEQDPALSVRNSIGLVETPGGSCTGVLVAADVVLTAARCVDNLPRDWTIRFRAGFDGARSVADRAIITTVIDAGWPGMRGGRLDVTEIPNDLALLALDAPVPASTAEPLPVLAVPPESERVRVLSYGSDNGPAQQEECGITSRFANGTLGFVCSAAPGSPGAPVLVDRNGRLQLLSLVSGGGNGAAYGARLSGRIQPLMAQLRREGTPPEPALGTRRITIGGSGRGRPEGAKFITP